MSSCVWSIVDKLVEVECCARSTFFPSIIVCLRPTFAQQACSFILCKEQHSQSQPVCKHSEWPPPQPPPCTASLFSLRQCLRSPFPTLTRRTPACTGSVWWPRQTALYHPMESQSFSRWNRNSHLYPDSRLTSTSSNGCASQVLLPRALGVRSQLIPLSMAGRRPNLMLLQQLQSSTPLHYINRL